MLAVCQQCFLQQPLHDLEHSEADIERLLKVALGHLFVTGDHLVDYLKYQLLLRDLFFQLLRQQFHFLKQHIFRLYSSVIGVH